ncbi:hypothetical protein IJH16_02300 [Candidatus Saccharibacteria bacterium]|nr:hypothetical protein [Candidatus Saccharibacteria bacterium]
MPPSRSTSARRYPLSYVFSGYYVWGNGNLYNQDAHGNWWSTAAYSDSSAYALGMVSSNLFPQNNLNKANGFTLRCETWQRGNPVLLSSPGSCGVNTLDILIPTI